MANSIFFIGNGFDLHHRIPSSFKNYASWLCKNDVDLFLKIDKVYKCCDKNWWADFETQIGELDVEAYSAEVYRVYGPDFGSDNYREADRYAAEIKAEQELKELFLKVKYSFYKWVQQLPLANVLRKVMIDTKDSFFVSFNYTDTLRRLYNIPNDKVCYIHGNARRGDELVLGHGKTKEQLLQPTKMPINLSKEQQQEWIDENITDDSYHRTVEASVDAVSAQRKEVEMIIRNNGVIWNQMKNAHYFYIYGLSFSSIDVPYIKKALSMMNRNELSIYVSYYNQQDKDKIFHFFQQEKFPVDKITLVNLEDIMVYS